MEIGDKGLQGSKVSALRFRVAAFGRGAYIPRGSIYTTIMELGLKNHNEDGLLGPNSIMVVYMDPLG